MRLIALALVLCIQRVACAAPPTGIDADSDIAKWFKSLKQPLTGAGCCSVADCRPVKTRLTETGAYEVWIEDEWTGVPNGVILRTDSGPVPTSVACYTHIPEWNGTPSGGYDRIEVLCFVPYRPLS